MSTSLPSEASARPTRLTAPDQAASATVGKPRISPIELIREAEAGLMQRPGRSVLTALGTVLGVGVLVTVLGLTATAAAQISQRFDAMEATEISVTQAPQADADPTALAFGDDAAARALRIDGVTAFGLSWAVKRQPTPTVSRFPPWLSRQQPVATVPVRAVSPGEFTVMHSSFATGRPIGTFDETSRAPVAVVGPAAAAALGLTIGTAQQSIFIDGMAFTVIGFMSDVRRHPEALGDVLVPEKTAVSLWGPPDPGEPATAHVEVRQGAAEVVGRQIAVALRPNAEQQFSVKVPPDPKTLRGQVGGDMGALFLLLAGICLVVGMVGIANTTLVSVLERVPEIGLRRAMGARPRQIAMQFLVESMALGAAGGLVGSCVGVVLLVAICLAQDWTAVIPPTVALAGPIMGALTGLLAGVYPAWRASRIEPVAAIRR